MTENQFKDKLNQYVEQIEAAIGAATSDGRIELKKIAEAMRYSLLAGGKRLRPMLLLEFNRVCGGDMRAAMPFACAMEMIHTYSLIHDDLPCMDDDELRRGKPTNHVVYGEAPALLAGDGLLNFAFETMTDPNNPQIDPTRAIGAIRQIAACSGVNGMIGGQVMDMDSFESVKTETELRKMHSMKTGALIKAACKSGCILAGAEREQIEAADKYAECLGTAFQIRDDMLDIIGNSGELGKNVNCDEKMKKTTFCTLYGIETCDKFVHELTEQAIDALKSFDDAEFLVMLARSLTDRKK